MLGHGKRNLEMGFAMLSVCVCTHNPRRAVLALVIESITKQSVPFDDISVTVVDNASSPPLDRSVLDPLLQRGVSSRLIQEPTPGLQHARIAALRNTNSEWVLWVDDDNELFPDFIKIGLDFIAKHPEVGCFGGKLLLPLTKRVAKWVTPFLPYLGIKDAGNILLIERIDHWTPVEPAGAGAWVHRKVLDAYLRQAETDEAFFELGRVGGRGLASCDDSMMMRGAIRCDLACAYVPSLRLYHHIDTEKRFNFRYLVRLMYAYGVSHVVLESVCSGPQAIPDYYSSKKQFLKLLWGIAKEGKKQSLAFGIGMAAYHLGSRTEHFRQYMVKK
jgi:Glycosyl transferase family 2